MKRILIDLDRLKNVNTGLGQVSLFFGKYIASINNPEIEFTYLVPKKYVGYFGNNVKYVKTSFFRRHFPRFFKDFDLWYSSHQDSAFFPASKNTPYILTIHDLNFLSEKTEKKAKRRLKRLQKKVDRASHICTISNFSKNEILKNLDTKNKQVTVIYNGVEVVEFDSVKKPSYVPDGDIIFSIGVVKEKKNTEVLVPFIEQLPPNFKLIIAGDNRSKYAERIAKSVKERGLEDRIIISGQISDEDKFWLLKNCKALVFPSKHEGMGIPPIEAMYFGKPVFASKFSSIPEICQENAYYWENFEPNYMANSFKENISSFYNSQTKSETLKKYAKKFSWQQNTKNYLELFNKYAS